MSYRKIIAVKQMMLEMDGYKKYVGCDATLSCGCTLRTPADRGIPATGGRLWCPIHDYKMPGMFAIRKGKRT